MATDVSQLELKEYFEYKDGGIYWIKPGRSIKIGKRFGCLKNDGYRIGGIKRRLYREHRLIWLYHYGVWPEKHLDHINGIRDDNRIENLREASPLENQFNKVGNLCSTSKYKGVDWHNQTKKWRARYMLHNKGHYLGLFDTELEAAIAYDKATKPIHQSFQKENSYD